MNCFEQVCDDCPIREKIDVSRTVRISDPESGDLTGFHDGFRDLPLKNLSEKLWSKENIEDAIAGNIDMCKGVGSKALSTVCGAGFGKVYRLERRFPESNISIVSDIEHYVSAGRPPRRLFGMQIDLAMNMVQVHDVLDDIIGTEAAIAKNARLCLSRPNLELQNDFPDIWSLMISPGPSFAFRYDRSTSPRSDFDEYSTVVFNGVFKFINARTEELQNSHQLHQAIEGVFTTANEETQAAINKYFQDKFRFF